MDFSKLAEVDLLDLDLNSSEEEMLDCWLRDHCSFKHNDAYEFIIHLYSEESDEWFLKNEVSPKLPDRVVKLLLKARQSGAARICFYS